jgi:hypothetical protein
MMMMMMMMMMMIFPQEAVCDVCDAGDSLDDDAIVLCDMNDP